jgi:hypothetical protein
LVKAWLKASWKCAAFMSSKGGISKGVDHFWSKGFVMRIGAILEWDRFTLRVYLRARPKRSKNPLNIVICEEMKSS